WRALEYRDLCATGRLGGRPRPDRLQRDAGDAATGDANRTLAILPESLRDLRRPGSCIGHRGYLWGNVLFGGGAPPRVWHPDGARSGKEQYAQASAGTRFSAELGRYRDW